jgi:hypothetical protein
MIVFYIGVGMMVIAFALVLWSYIDDLKMVDEYYPSSADLDKHLRKSTKSVDQPDLFKV